MNQVHSRGSKNSGIKREGSPSGERPVALPLFIRAKENAECRDEDGWQLTIKLATEIGP